MPFQTTLRRPVSLTGEGLHLGTDTTVELRPAAPGSGYYFRRPSCSTTIPATPSAVVQTMLATTLGNDEWSVATVEHLLAALRGMQLDNVEIVVDGDEIPALDGSARPWVELVDEAGIQAQRAPRRVLVVREEIEVRMADRWARLVPAPRLEIQARIVFEHPGVGEQDLDLVLENGTFAHQLAWARTFGFLEDVERMRSMGLAKGGGLHNAVVYGPDGPLNPEGLRAADELVRHKLLDIVGDLALVGMPLVGRLEANKPGHALTVALVGELMSRPAAGTVVESRESA